jgi:hypothetical protein
VVDPDKVNVVQGDTVSTPDVLGVNVGDCDVPKGRKKVSLLVADRRLRKSTKRGDHVLDDNVANAANKTQTLTLDDTGVALAEEGLVGVDGDTEGTGVVTTDSF